MIAPGYAVPGLGIVEALVTTRDGRTWVRIQDRWFPKEHL